MKITVIGATGMVGQRVVAEAARRGHEVVAAGRKGSPVEGAGSTLAVDVNDTQALVQAIEAGDVAVISVPGPRDGDSNAIIPVHQRLIAAKPSKRLLVVGGAGSLFTPEGVRLKDTEGFPAEYLAEAEAFTHVLEAYQDSTGLDWTVISPAPVLAPGERTGDYRSAGEQPAGDSVSAEDLAVAIVDELENPQHGNGRFTVAN